MNKIIAVLAASVVIALPTLAQQSASFRIENGVFNAAGHAGGGTLIASSNFRITLASLGGTTTSTTLGSGSFRVDGGFTSSYAPPGEVPHLDFTDSSTLEWHADPSASAYNLYRDSLDFMQVTYGVCEQPGLRGTTATDTTPVPAGGGFFYLVTAVNRLGEDGTKGSGSNDIERPNDAPCP